jgi:flotillin
MLEIIISLWWLWIIIITVLTIIVTAVLYTIVPADKADVVIQRGRRRIFSSHPDYQEKDNKKAAYFKVPSWVPGAGMVVHRMPLKILSIPIPDFLAFDKDRARFVCDIVAYAIVKDPVTAAMRFPETLKELSEDISKVVVATTRDSTTKKPVREIINDREGIIQTINKPLSDALLNWGLELRDIELIDFKDPSEPIYEGEKPPQVIKDISSIIEVQINSEARQKNAEQLKIARLKEAEAEEIAKMREIKRDEEIGKRDKKRDQEIAKEAKKAMEETLEVRKVEQVKSQQIEKERAVVEANQKKDVELVIKTQKQLTGEGDRLMKEEQAKGEAAFIREKGYADADAKQKLQDALNKFGENAIRALIAEIMVEKDRQIGVETAKALKEADLKVFSGGDAGKQGFDLGQMVNSLGVADEGGKASLLNRLAQPNDLGFKKLNMDKLMGIISEREDLQRKLKEAIIEKEQQEQKVQEEQPKSKARRKNLP